MNFKPAWIALFLLSAAALTFEINLTRLFSVAQFYHFAFMIVSIALLGSGASGTALTLFPALLRGDPRRRLAQFSLAAGVSMLLAYLLTDWLPFDSFSMLVDRRQIAILALHYLALAAPFFFSGIALAWLLAASPAVAGTTYAVNLLGSAGGCVLALLAPPYLGGEGLVTLSAGLAALAAAFALIPARPVRLLPVLGSAALLLIALGDISLRLIGSAGLLVFELRISPYKSLSYALQAPGAEVIFRRWNAFSRVDVVRSQGIHSLPGLSYRYLQPLPVMDGLLVDGDDLSVIPRLETDPAFTAYLPGALAFQLRPEAKTLILGARGGLDILTALSQSKGALTAVEVNPLIVAAAPLYAHPRVETRIESERSFLQRSQERFDVIILSLNSSYHPVQSGAYTLAEDYRYTREFFRSMLAHLNPGGLLVATRWLQDPPSEDLRLLALAASAVEEAGGDPRQQVAAIRGYNTATVFIRNGAFSPEELAQIRAFTSQLAFDLSYLPGIRAEDTNQYNILAESTYYQTYLRLLEAGSAEEFYADYPYDIRPPSDDRPFFGHYFKWAQAPQIIAGFGRSWQPFGGAGYFVILALFLLALLLASGLILLPVILRQKRPAGPNGSPYLLRNLIYFGLLGLAFMMVEIPLLQRFILYLGQPAYAVAAVLFSLLLFSGIGSRLSERIPLRAGLGGLVILILVAPLLLPVLFDATLGWPLAARLAATALALAPLGFLMGVPFPSGIRLLAAGQAQGGESGSPGSIPWVWAVNGAASVIAPILAALLALSLGFNAVLRLGGLCYLGALITAWLSLRPRSA
jgi:hypothetical protein